MITLNHCQKVASRVDVITLQKANIEIISAGDYITLGGVVTWTLWHHCICYDNILILNGCIITFEIHSGEPIQNPWCSHLFDHIWNLDVTDSGC